MINALLDYIASNGDRGAIIPFSHIYDLKSEMEALKSHTHHSWIDWMLERMGRCNPNELGFQPLSLISVITSSPKVLLEFNYCGKSVNCIVPPIYSDEWSINRKILLYIDDYLTPLGYKATFTYDLPQKLLAVHCGLGLYGRNNICFNEEFGSYMRVLSYVSDFPSNDATWVPIRHMEACEKCRACITSCPTNAIDANRSIIKADRCLTAMNEFAGEFPEWVNKDSHNCIIGCMKCQDCCPSNLHNKNNIINGVAFTEEETMELLSHKFGEPFSDLLAEKIKSTGISSAFSQLLPRNLAILLRS